MLRSVNCTRNAYKLDSSIKLTVGNCKSASVMLTDLSSIRRSISTAPYKLVKRFVELFCSVSNSSDALTEQIETVNGFRKTR